MTPVSHMKNKGDQSTKMKQPAAFSVVSRDMKRIYFFTREMGSEIRGVCLGEALPTNKDNTCTHKKTAIFFRNLGRTSGIKMEPHSISLVATRPFLDAYLHGDEPSDGGLRGEVKEYKKKKKK